MTSLQLKSIKSFFFILVFMILQSTLLAQLTQNQLKLKFDFNADSLQLNVGESVEVEIRLLNDKDELYRLKYPQEVAVRPVALYLKLLQISRVNMSLQQGMLSTDLKTGFKQAFQ
jgi:hypothetical protein